MKEKESPGTRFVCARLCVWSQDVGLPFMLDHRLDPDTLFLIFEEDWRLEPEEMLDAVAGPERQPSRDPGFQMIGRRAQGSNYGIPKAGCDAGVQDSDTIVSDMVAYCNKASRLGIEIFWMTWQPGQGKNVKRSQSIRSGSMLLAFSQAGAAKVSRAIEEGKIVAGHWDLVLLDFVKEYAKETFAYLVPPMGNYSSHVSGCSDDWTQEIRPSRWGTSWCCPGTRKEDDPQLRDKWLAFPTDKGPPQWIAKIDLDQEFQGLVWTTYWDLPSIQRPDLRQQKRSEDAEEFTPSTGSRGITAKASRKIRGAVLRQGQFRIWVDDASKAAHRDTLGLGTQCNVFASLKT
jgi:hypothetical protein